MKNIFNKKLFDKKHFTNVYIFILILIFSSLIIYQIYLAIIHKQDTIYSKIVEGLTPTIPQENIAFTSTTTLPDDYYKTIITDISNIEILYNNLNSIWTQVNGMINNNNANSSNTPINAPTQCNITPFNTITPESNTFDICNASNTATYNITTINGCITNIFNALQQFPNSESVTNNARFTTLPSINTISCGNESSVSAGTVGQTGNTIISDLNNLNGNTISLNNAVTALQNNQNSQANNQYKSASTISKSFGVNPN